MRGSWEKYNKEKVSWRGNCLPGTARHEHRHVIRQRPRRLGQTDEPLQHLLGVCRPLELFGQDRIVQRQFRPPINQTVTVEYQGIPFGKADRSFLVNLLARHPEGNTAGGKVLDSAVSTPHEGIAVAAVDESQAPLRG